nr:putative P protein [Styphnolobium-associated cytorhabdovirus]
MNFPKDLIGKGLRNNPNAFFANGTAPLFAIDPDRTPDEKLPVVQAYSGLSRNKRKKNKNWASDPEITRQRMANAQAQLTNRLAEGELKDKISYIDAIFDSLAKDGIPESQSHFTVPASVVTQNAMKSSGTEPLTVKQGTAQDVTVAQKWADVVDSDEEVDEVIHVEPTPEEKALDQAIEQVTERFNKVVKGVSKKGRSVEDVKRSKVLSSVWRKRSPAGFGRRHVSHSPRASRSPPAPEEISDFNSARKMISYMFNNENIGLSRHFEDDLIRLFNERGYLTEDLIYMYICGIRKERQNSLTNRQEALVSQLSTTAASYGKQLEILKTQIKILSGSDSYPVQKSQEFNERRPNIPAAGASLTKVINPPPIYVAPKKKTEYQPKLTGVVIKEPEMQKVSTPEPVVGTGKGLSDESSGQGKQTVDTIEDVTEVEKMENLMKAITNVGFPLQVLSTKQLSNLLDLVSNKTLVSMINVKSDGDRVVYLGLLTDVIMTV